MGTTSTYQSNKTKLPGDKYASAWYINSKGHKWAKLEDILDPGLAQSLVPGKHIRYPTKDDDDFCLVQSEQYGLNVFRNTPEQVDAFWQARQEGKLYAGATPGQQKLIGSLKPPAPEQGVAPLHPEIQGQVFTNVSAIQPKPQPSVMPSTRAAVMLTWKFWEDQAGLDVLKRNDEAGWIIEKMDTLTDGHLVVMRRK